MARPPPDANPEQFVIGRGLYDNRPHEMAYNDSSVFRIDPVPMPYVGIVVYDAVFAAAAYGFHWMFRRYAPDAGVWGIYVAPIGIGAMTCIVYTVIVWVTQRKEIRSGPWLIYEKGTRRVILPRQHMTFARAEVVHLQYITTKRLDWGGVVNNDQVSELNLITQRDEKRERWPLLRSAFTVRAFDHILLPLVQNTDLPVVRVRDQWLGWKVTEVPYAPGS